MSPRRPWQTPLGLAASLALLIACSADNGSSAGSGGHTAGTGGVSAGGGGSSAAGTGGAAVGTGGASVGKGGSTAGSGGGAGLASTGGARGGSSGSSNAGAGGQAGSGVSLDASAAGGAAKDGGGIGGGGGQSGIDGAASSDGPTLPPVTNYSDKGPFATTVDKNVGPNNGYTVFRPDPLGQNGFLHAPIIFGPGIGQSVTVHTTMLTNFASHGFVVVGTPVLNDGPGGANNRKSMQDGLDWIVKQDTTQGSIYQGKLYADHAVSMGFSVGGTSAVQVGGSPAVITVVSIHGHTATASLHGTMLQTTGTKDTAGMPLQQATFDASKVPTFLATLVGAPHQYIESNGGGDERPAIVAWMRYWIYNDAGARKYFWGDSCVLCTTPWQNPQRKNWQ